MSKDKIPPLRISAIKAWFKTVNPRLTFTPGSSCRCLVAKYIGGGSVTPEMWYPGGGANGRKLPNSISELVCSFDRNFWGHKRVSAKDVLAWLSSGRPLVWP